MGGYDDNYENDDSYDTVSQIWRQLSYFSIARLNSPPQSQYL